MKRLCEGYNTAPPAARNNPMQDVALRPHVPLNDDRLMKATKLGKSDDKQKWDRLKRQWLDDIKG